MKDGIKVLNLGAGVQSTTLALMSQRGEIEKFDFAIFADTGEEPAEVYSHLEWLTNEVSAAFPVIVRSAGKLGDDLTKGVNSTGGRFASIPAFTSSGVGREGMLRRQCTKEYKTDVIYRSIRRDILGLAPGKHVPAGVTVVQFIGLSYDEPGRVINVRRRMEGHPWSLPRFPLFDMEMTRRGCLSWLKRNYPARIVPRSACVFCPFHSNEEWRRIKETDPAGWARAVEVDSALRAEGVVINRNVEQKLYVHRDCAPLASVDLRDQDTKRAQETFGFAQECEGMCGL